MLMMRPNPRHAGQAPTGLLKLKSAGEASRYSMSHCAQWRRLEKWWTTNVPSLDPVLPLSSFGGEGWGEEAVLSCALSTFWDFSDTFLVNGSSRIASFPLPK